MIAWLIVFWSLHVHIYVIMDKKNQSKDQDAVTIKQIYNNFCHIYSNKSTPMINIPSHFY